MDAQKRITNGLLYSFEEYYVHIYAYGMMGTDIVLLEKIGIESLLLKQRVSRQLDDAHKTGYISYWPLFYIKVISKLI